MKALRMDESGLRTWAQNEYPSGISKLVPNVITGSPDCSGTHLCEARHENHLWQRHCQAA
jgi:hypothetical protein